MCADCDSELQRRRFTKLRQDRICYERQFGTTRFNAATNVRTGYKVEILECHRLLATGPSLHDVEESGMSGSEAIRTYFLAFYRNIHDIYRKMYLNARLSQKKTCKN